MIYLQSTEEQAVWVCLMLRCKVVVVEEPHFENTPSIIILVKWVTITGQQFLIAKQISFMTFESSSSWRTSFWKQCSKHKYTCRKWSHRILPATNKNKYINWKIIAYSKLSLISHPSFGPSTCKKMHSIITSPLRFKPPPNVLKWIWLIMFWSLILNTSKCKMYFDLPQICILKDTLKCWAHHKHKKKFFLGS